MRILIAASAAALLLAGAPLAAAHSGNPNMRSEVTAITPATEGITVEVLNYDDRLELHNTSGKPVVVEGYSGEPYARVLGDGTVQVNTNSEAYYLNDDRFGEVKVPSGLPKQPRWKQLSRSGRFEWHDHRMHWMSKSKPPQVTDEDARAHFFDWKVPITVGGAQGQIAGTLDWVPLPGGGLPSGLIWITAAPARTSLRLRVPTRRRPRLQPRRPATAARTRCRSSPWCSARSPCSRRSPRSPPRAARAPRRRRGRRWRQGPDEISDRCAPVC